MTPTITGLYAGLLALMFVPLSFRVIRMRYRKRIGIMDGGDREMGRAMRAHGNFTEYVPLALILMALVEINGAPLYLVHLYGAVLVGGRVLHAFGLSRSSGASRPRVVGMIATFVVIVSTGITAITQFTGT